MTVLPNRVVQGADLSADSGPRSATLSSRPDDSQSAPTQLAILYWLAALDASEVRFALLRGHDAASAQRKGSDLDLIVHPEDQTQLLEHLEAACQHSGVHVVQTFDSPHARQIMLHGRSPHGEHHLISLDIHTAETCYGVPYWEAEDVLFKAQSQPVKRFEKQTMPQHEWAPCLPSTWADLARFQNRFLCGANLIEGDIRFFSEAGSKDQHSIEQELRRWYGAQLAERIIDALREGDPSEFSSFSKKARRTLLLRRFRSSPWQSLKSFLKTASALRVRPYLRPRGLCVAFLGTDGSGKTTLIENFRAAIEPHYRDGQNGVRKLRPGLLPQINRLWNWRQSSYTAEDCQDPHRAKPSGFFGSALRASWYALDCVIGWPLRISPLRRRNALLIFDRYYHDFLVDPLRARIHSRSRMPRLWSRIVPQPDHILVCIADPDRISARKQELPEREIERQVAAYEAMAKSFPRMHIVHTDGSVEDSLDQVLSAVFPPKKR